jgi:hypothetical protein
MDKSTKICTSFKLLTVRFFMVRLRQIKKMIVRVKVENMVPTSFCGGSTLFLVCLILESIL